MKSYKALVANTIKDVGKELAKVSITHYGYSKITYESSHLDWELMREVFSLNTKTFSFLYNEDELKFECVLTFADDLVATISKDYAVALPLEGWDWENIFESMFNPAAVLSAGGVK